MKTLLRTAAALFLTAAPLAIAADHENDEATIRKGIAAYTEAFNRGDAKALAEFWSPTGTWSDPGTGETIKGRENILAAFTTLLEENKGARLETEIQSIQFVTGDVAVEEGVGRVILAGSSPSRSTYSAIHVKKDGQWLLDRVIETGTAPSAPGKQLEALAWLTGEWIDQAGNSTIHFQNVWIADGRYLKRTFTVYIEDRVSMNGVEIVGWDPAAQAVRSWVFDSEGSFAELKWQPAEDNPDSWIKQATGVLHGGEKVSAVHIMTRIDDDTYTFRAVSREEDGNILPNIDEVTVVRAES
jgi:uncharacterized protein (TIGR02246 family)